LWRYAVHINYHIVVVKGSRQMYSEKIWGGRHTGVRIPPLPMGVFKSEKMGWKYRKLSGEWPEWAQR